MNGHDDQPPRRSRRRSVRPAGTVGGDDRLLRSAFPAPSDTAPPPSPAPAGDPPAATPSRAPDDLDVGWGAPVDDSNDDRLTREKPPHW